MNIGQSAPVAFISLPIEGKTYGDIKDIIANIRNVTKTYLREFNNVEKVCFEDTFITDSPEDSYPPQCMPRRIEALLYSRYVIMADSHEKARECRIERLIALEYGKTILYYENMKELLDRLNVKYDKV